MNAIKRMRDPKVFYEYWALILVSIGAIIMLGVGLIIGLFVYFK